MDRRAQVPGFGITGGEGIGDSARKQPHRLRCDMSRSIQTRRCGDFRVVARVEIIAPHAEWVFGGRSRTGRRLILVGEFLDELLEDLEPILALGLWRPGWLHSWLFDFPARASPPRRGTIEIIQDAQSPEKKEHQRGGGDHIRQHTDPSLGTDVYLRGHEPLNPPIDSNPIMGPQAVTRNGSGTWHRQGFGGRHSPQLRAKHVSTRRAPFWGSSGLRMRIAAEFHRRSTAKFVRRRPGASRGPALDALLNRVSVLSRTSSGDLDPS